MCVFLNVCVNKITSADFLFLRQIYCENVLFWRVKWNGLQTLDLDNYVCEKIKRHDLNCICQSQKIDGFDHGVEIIKIVSFSFVVLYTLYIRKVTLNFGNLKNSNLTLAIVR